MGLTRRAWVHFHRMATVEWLLHYVHTILHHDAMRRPSPIQLRSAWLSDTFFFLNMLLRTGAASLSENLVTWIWRQQAPRCGIVRLCMLSSWPLHNIDYLTWSVNSSVIQHISRTRWGFFIIKRIISQGGVNRIFFVPPRHMIETTPSCKRRK